MIPKYQRIAYWCLVGGILLMALLLIRGCFVTHARVIAQRDASPIPAPVDAPDETAQIATANDADSTVTLDPITLPLPQDPSVRAHILIARFLADAALPGSTHPLPAGPAVNNVFFLALPITNKGDRTSPDAEPTPASDTSPYGTTHYNGSVLAVIDLTQTFADAHPSSALAEDLTLRAIMATLHADFPEVVEVRFLVNGQTRETLNGHADLTRPYAIADPTVAIHQLAADGNPE